MCETLGYLLIALLVLIIGSAAHLGLLTFIGVIAIIGLVIRLAAQLISTGGRSAD